MSTLKTLSLLLLLHFCHLISAELLNLQNVEIPDMDDFAAIKDKCDKQGGNGTYETLKTSKEALQSCLQGFVDFTVLKNEVEEAKKTGSMDEVFGKYCNKRPRLAGCVRNFTDALRPCLNDDEKNALNTTLDILKQLGEFVCYRDGDRIAMFVAEGGVECIKDHKEGIQKCVNKTFKITPATVNTNSIPTLLIDKKKCDDFGKLQECVVEELEKCQDSTPANIVDALFRFIKRSACSNKHKRSIRSIGIVKRSLELTHALNTTEIRGNLMSLMKEKCNQNAPEGGFDAFTESFSNATNCLGSSLRNHPIFNTALDEFKQQIKKCFEKVVEKATACLADEEKFWPQYQVDVLLNLIDVSYRYQDVVRRPLSRSEIINCFQHFRQQSVQKEISNCIGSPNDPPNSLHKEEVCRRIKNLKKCFSEQYKKNCIREVTITKLFDDLFEALAAPPCDNNNQR